MLLQEKMRQLAIVLTLAEESIAEAWLGRLPEEAADRVRDQMRRLGRISESEYRNAIASVASILNQFSSTDAPSEPPASVQPMAGSVLDSVTDEIVANGERLQGHVSESDREGIARLVSKDKTFAEGTVTVTPIPDSPVASATDDAIEKLDRIIEQFNREDLAGLIAQESPRVIAALLRSVRANARCKVTSLLSPEAAVEVFPLYARAEKVALVVIEEMHLWLETLQSHVQRCSLAPADDAIEHLSSYLLQLSDTERTRFIEELAARDPELANRVQNATVSVTHIDLRVSRQTADSSPDSAIACTAPSLCPQEEAAMQVVNVPTLNLWASDAVGESLTRSNTAEAVVLELPPNAGPIPFTLAIEELARLSDSDLGKVIRSASPEIVLRVLKGDAAGLTPRVLQLFSDSDRERIRKRLDAMDRVTSVQYEEALNELGTIAGRLIVQGQIATLYNLTVTSAA